MKLADELEQAFKTATGSVRLNTPKPYVLWWPNGHPTFIAVPEDRSYGHKEAQRDGQIVADFTLAGDKWAALFALIIKRMPAILAALSTDRAPADVEGLPAKVERLETMLRHSIDAMAIAAHELESTAPFMPEQSRPDMWRSAAQCRALASSYSAAIEPLSKYGHGSAGPENNEG